MLGEQIRWIVFTSDLQQGQRPVAHPLLYPQALSVHVSELAKALPATNADRGGAVCPHPERQDDTDIRQQGSVTQAHTRGLQDPVELRLAAAEGYRRLG